MGNPSITLDGTTLSPDISSANAVVPSSISSTSSSLMPPQSQSQAQTLSPALSLHWSFGFNPNRHSTVHSLTTPSRSAILYTSSHFAIIHDLTTDTQQQLTGHTHNISCVCVTRDKSLIITADEGGKEDTDSVIIVWDSQTATPQRILNVWSGVRDMDVSEDGRHLAVIHEQDGDRQQQHISIYEWNTETDIHTEEEGSPVLSVALPVCSTPYHCIRFHPTSSYIQLVVNSSTHVLFFHQDITADNTPILTLSCPSRGEKKMKSQHGFTQSCFIPNTDRAVTATAAGHICVWDQQTESQGLTAIKPPSDSPINRTAIKMLKLLKSPITLLCTVLDSFLVCGCKDGCVRVFDFHFRVVGWFEDIGYGQGGITSISFDDLPLPHKPSPRDVNHGLTEAIKGGNTEMEKLIIPSFIISSSKGKIVALTSTTFTGTQTQAIGGKKAALLLSSFDRPLSALTSHPSLPVFAVGSSGGTISIWDMEDKRVIGNRHLPSGQKTKDHTDKTLRAQQEEKEPIRFATSKGTSSSATNHRDAQSSTAEESSSSSVHITCLRFSCRGHLLAVGLNNGVVRIVNTASISSTAVAPTAFLSDVATFHRSSAVITHLAFSACSTYLATADAEYNVSLYRLAQPEEQKDKDKAWVYVGRYRSHYNNIVALTFDDIYTAGGTTTTQQQQQQQQQQEQERNSSNTSPTRPSVTRLPPLSTALPPRLYSVGADGLLQEYDVLNSSIRNGLKLKYTMRVEEDAAQPTAMLRVSGSVFNAGRQGVDRIVEDEAELMIIANNQHKLRVMEMKQHTQTVSHKGRHNGPSPSSHWVLRKTVCAPSFSGGISHLLSLPAVSVNAHSLSLRSECSPFLLFASPVSYCGLLSLPLCGNPHTCVSLLSHPCQSVSLAASFDGEFVLSIGEQEQTVKMWRVNTSALTDIEKQGGQGLTPYLSLLGEETSASSQLSQLSDYFYYSEIVSQGEDSREERVITNSIPVSEIPRVCAAVGLYLSDREAEEMMAEVCYHNSLKRKTPPEGEKTDLVERVQWEDFVRLFVNHRPVLPEDGNRLEWAFRTLAAGHKHVSLGEQEEDETGHILVDTEQLFRSVLSGEGGMTEAELFSCLSCLVDPRGGKEMSIPRRDSLNEGEELSQSMLQLINRLPRQMTAAQFAPDVLAREVCRLTRPN